MHSHPIIPRIALVACFTASVSKGYHYLGSAKILGRIGEAFAKAMIELKRP